MSSSPKQLQLYLMPPNPGAKPDFLATLEGTAKSPIPSDLPDKMILENYTRDPWAWKPNPSTWQAFTTTSVDGRNKLPGFLKYLKERTKSAFGRFADKECILVISYIQKKPAAGADVVADPTALTMECRVSWDIGSIVGCPMKPPPPKPVPQVLAAVKPKAAAVPAPAKPKRKGGGFLGSLVSSQKRTNAHVEKAIGKKPNAAGGDGGDGSSSGAGASNRKTAQQVMAEFRQTMEEKMLDFDLSSEPVLKVPINVSAQQRELSTIEDKARITMEILKYMVYESVEEVNETWVAYKEPSEFMDETTIAVYKEGQAPPEVLEEINRGELPDEIRGQQQAMQAAQQKQAEMRENSKAQELTRKALAERAAEDDDEGALLNQNKRDRRTIEEIQQDAAKRSRTS